MSSGAVQGYRVSTGPWTPEAWEDEWARATEFVKDCFERAAPQLALPTEIGCREFAQYLIWSSAYGDPEVRDHRTQHRTVLSQSARTLLENIVPEREILDLMLRGAIAFRWSEKKRRMRTPSS